MDVLLPVAFIVLFNVRTNSCEVLFIDQFFRKIKSKELFLFICRKKMILVIKYQGFYKTKLFLRVFRCN